MESVGGGQRLCGRAVAWGKSELDVEAKDLRAVPQAGETESWHRDWREGEWAAQNLVSKNWLSCRPEDMSGHPGGAALEHGLR